MKLPCSPYYIIVFIRKFSLLLLTFPLQSLLITNSDSRTKVFFVTADLTIFAIILLCATISCHNRTLYISPSRFTLSKGVLRKQKLSLQKSALDSINITQNFLQRLLGVCKITLVSGKGKGEFLLSKNHLVSLHSNTLQSTSVFRSDLANILIISVGLSPAFGAALSVAPLVRSLSRLPAIKLTSSVSLWDKLGYKGLPPLLSSVSSLLFILWLAGVTLSAQKLWKLSFNKVHSHLLIKSGLISKRCLYFLPKNIKAIIFKQSLLMLILHRKRADFILATEEKSAHITAGCIQNIHQYQLILNMSEISLPQSKLNAKPGLKAIISYTLLPLLSLATLSLITILVSYYSPYRIEPHLGIFFFLWCCVWFLHRCIAFCRCEISLDITTMKICTFTGLVLIEAFVPITNITCAKITQNIFQRIKGTCNLRIYIKSNRRKSYVLRHISAKKAAELTKKLCG